MMKQSNKANRRPGFTLVELMIVLTIILIILSMTVAAVNFATESDRVSGEASRIQSFIAGARDRAIYNDEMRGVRLFVDPAPPGSPFGPSEFSRTVTAMAYIAPGGTWGAPEHSAGIDLLRNDGNSDGDFEDDQDLLVRVRGHHNPGWWNLKRRGWLVDGLRMRIPAGPSGHWYTINTALIDTTAPPTQTQYLLLDIPYADGGNLGQEVAWEDLTYEIEFPARVLPQEPLLLSDGVVIDLDGSDVPDIWRPAATGNGLYSGYMDIWFSPRGNIIGDAAAQGVLHFYVTDAEDSRFLKTELVDDVGLAGFDAGIGAGTAFIPLDELDPASVTWLNWDGPYIVKDRRLVTIFAQTGAISVNRVNAYSGSSPVAGLAADPYLFAETGESAK